MASSKLRVTGCHFPDPRSAGPGWKIEGGWVRPHERGKLEKLLRMN